MIKIIKLVYNNNNYKFKENSFLKKVWLMIKISIKVTLFEI
jgi:hypothetical protein